MNNSSQNQTEIDKVELGRLSPEEITAYVRRNHNLDERSMSSFMEVSELRKVDVESIIQSKISDLNFYLIKEFGLSAGALLMREFDWELVAVLTGKTSVNYMLETIKLDVNEEFKHHLTESERKSLRFISNAYRIAISQNTYSKNLIKHI